MKIRSKRAGAAVILVHVANGDESGVAATDEIVGVLGGNLEM